MIEIIEQPIDWYIDRLKNSKYFSFPGYSDAEWIAMRKNRIGESTAAGQIWTEEIGEKLKAALRVALISENILPAVPKILLSPESGVGQGEMKKLINELGFTNAVFYERDMVTDDLAARAGLRPLITQLREMDVYIVSNICLKGLHFLKAKRFFVTETLYNFHMVDGGIERMVEEIAAFGKSGVYLFSVGMSDAVMISSLHGRMPDSFLLDCGSIWDAFIGIGGQREWRAKLYANPQLWLEWLKRNLT